jgi:hypothetical protein
MSHSLLDRSAVLAALALALAPNAASALTFGPGTFGYIGHRRVRFGNSPKARSPRSGGLYSLPDGTQVVARYPMG